MNQNEIRNEINRVIRHMPLCHTQKKENPGECNCYQKDAVEDLFRTMVQVVKGNR